MPIWLRLYTFNKLKEHYDTINGAKQKSAEESWLNGVAKDEAAKNKNMVKIPHFIKAPKKQ